MPGVNQEALAAAVLVAVAQISAGDRMGLHYGPHPSKADLETFADAVWGGVPMYSRLCGYDVSFVDVWTDACYESRFHRLDWDRLRGPRADAYCQAAGYFGMHPNFYLRHARTAGFAAPERADGESTQAHALRLTAHLRGDLYREIAVHAHGMVAFMRACGGDYACAVSYYRHGYIGAPDSEKTAEEYRGLRRKMETWIASEKLLTRKAAIHTLPRTKETP